MKKLNLQCFAKTFTTFIFCFLCLLVTTQNALASSLWDSTGWADPEGDRFAILSNETPVAIYDDTFIWDRTGWADPEGDRFAILSNETPVAIYDDGNDAAAAAAYIMVVAKK